MIRANISHTLQNSQAPKDKLSEDENKALKELQSDASVVNYQLTKVDLLSSLIVRGLFLKMQGHVNSGSYHLLKKDPTTKIKAKSWKQLKALKDNESIDNISSKTY